MVLDIEKSKFESRAKDIFKTIKNYENLHNIDKIGQILLKFSDELKNTIGTIAIKNDSQLIGMLAGFLSSVEPNANFDTSYDFPAGKQILRPTGLININNEKIALNILHAKRDRDYDSYNGYDVKNIEVETMKRFLDENNLQNGIVFYLPQEPDDMIILTYTSGKASSSKQNIREVYPDKKNFYSGGGHLSEENDE